MPKKADALITERHATHGSFAEVAALTSALVDVFKKSTSYPLMNETQKMSMKEIFHKVSRIGAGDPNHQDHWDDIGGYAELGSRACVSAPALPVRKPRKAHRPKQVRLRQSVRKRKAARPRKAAKVRRAPAARVRTRQAAQSVAQAS